MAAALNSSICVPLPTNPIGACSLDDTNNRVRLVVFLAEGLLLSGAMERLHAARWRSEASEREARRYQEELARSEARQDGDRCMKIADVARLIRDGGDPAGAPPAGP